MSVLASRSTAGLHYAVRILAGWVALWLIVHVMANQDPIWAVTAMIAVTEPQIDTARAAFRGRIANTAIGGVVGLLCLLVGGPRDGVLPVAMVVTVLASAYVVRVPNNWKVAPITAALVIASSLSTHSRASGEIAGLRRLAEVLLGSAMALLVSYVFSVLWPQPGPDASKEAHVAPTGSTGH